MRATAPPPLHHTDTCRDCTCLIRWALKQGLLHRYLQQRLQSFGFDTLYELHYCMITLGKVLCTKRSPNCASCPLVSWHLPRFSRKPWTGHTGDNVHRLLHPLVATTSLS